MLPVQYYVLRGEHRDDLPGVPLCSVVVLSFLLTVVLLGYGLSYLVGLF